VVSEFLEDWKWGAETGSPPLARRRDAIGATGCVVGDLRTGLVAATLWLAIPINRVLGMTGINVATRVMALIVASVGINFILTGIKDQFPGLVR
jgi:small neutral amino acid transporter SnatA (MarC family)